MQLLTSKRHLTHLVLNGLLLLSITLSVSAQQTDNPHQLSEFTGVWVRSINQRIFFVLRLQMYKGKLEGSLLAQSISVT